MPKQWGVSAFFFDCMLYGCMLHIKHTHIHLNIATCFAYILPLICCCCTPITYCSFRAFPYRFRLHHMNFTSFPHLSGGPIEYRLFLADLNLVISHWAKVLDSFSGWLYRMIQINDSFLALILPLPLIMKGPVIRVVGPIFEGLHSTKWSEAGNSLYHPVFFFHHPETNVCESINCNYRTITHWDLQLHKDKL